MTKSNRVKDLDDDSDPLARLRDERNALKIALKRYGRHTATCPAIAGRLCNCDWWTTAKKYGIK